ncbi:MAG TPA: CpaF family protein, partial [Bacillota bacterium]|nr:CpaF family protein [Bacillota bacterium]
MSLFQRKMEQLRERQLELVEAQANPAAPPKAARWSQAKELVMHRAVEILDGEAMEQMTEADRSVYIAEQIGNLVEQVTNEIDLNLSRGEYHRLAGEILSEITGYGPITPFLADPTVTEIMVNGPYQVYVERGGKLEVTDVRFRDGNHVLHIIERIVAPLGRRIDESSPMVDARLPDGSRVNAAVPPICLNGPFLTIRKFSSTPFTIADLIGFGTMSTNMAAFLKVCVKGRLNIVVAGGTGSGKTTTLNVLSSFIPNHERIVTIEDAAELQMQQEHLLRMESRPPNVEGKGRITIRDLVINSLRMRPDRIVVGEVRGAEALDMLQAMNTGHDGCLTTAHANSPRDVLARLETMILMAGVDLPLKAIREQIASAIDLIVFQSRLKDGSRRITSIVEVVGMEGEVITLQEIFSYIQQGLTEDGRVNGSFQASRVTPKFLPHLEAQGISIPKKYVC